MSPPRPVSPDATSARRSLILFLLAIPPLVAAPLALRARFGGAGHAHADFACLLGIEWVPAVAATLAILASREGFADLSLALPHPRRFAPFALAALAPLAVAIAGYGLSWSMGLAPFVPPPAPESAGVAAGFALFALRRLALGLPAWMLLALGEELGWRGFMLPRLLRSALSRPVLISGVIWSAWHWPSVLWGGYPAGPNRALSGVVITITLGAFACVLARLRLESGSIWPPALAHALWNSFMLDSFDRATAAGTIWTRESGLMVALASVTCAALVWRSPWSAHESRTNVLRTAGESSR
jgi:membrane protease YdiL (CAAX protease family)